MPVILALERLKQYDHFVSKETKFNSRCRNQNWLLSPNRKDKKNHTNKLRELALLIPVTMKTRDKKYTKVWGLKERSWVGGRVLEQ